MKTIKLDVQERQEYGKEKVKKIRAKDLIPAVIYGQNIDPISISVDYKTLEKFLNTGNGRYNLYSVTIKKKKIDIMIYDLQLHPIGKKILHIDFKTVKPTEKVKIKSKIKLLGTSIGVKKGGSISQHLDFITMKVLPDKIKKDIEVDVTNIDQGQDMFIKDLPLPKSSEVLKLSTERKVISVKA